ASTDSWVNVGGQLILKSDLEQLKNLIRSGKITEWPDVHAAYREIGKNYKENKRIHAQGILREIHFEVEFIKTLRNEALETAAFILDGIRESRKKDYINHFRNITFDSDSERDAVVGSFEENSFILDAEREFEIFQKAIKRTRN
ncbi:MAG: DUF4954 family protein, partial [Spirochaetaceae bacterium]|nr:DUF4954 family protein [Spirochaetaceae bacterium]